jgi:hypothetical protein
MGVRGRVLGLNSLPLRFASAKHKRNQHNSNYQRNLLALTGVPTMALVWVTKLFFSVPTTRPLAP